jgi:ABC-type bacteriocin/lantibiotic exporter with double-glycine peptidase domain
VSRGVASPPSRVSTLESHARALRSLLRARGDVAWLVALGIARHLLRLGPTLAIGLAIDRVASTRAMATLGAIVSALCVIALVETLFAAAHQRLRAGMTRRLAATTDGAGHRVAAGHAACVDLIASFGAAPPAVLGMVAAIALASGRLAAVVAALLIAQAAIAAAASPARGRIARALHAAERAATAARSEASVGPRLGLFLPSARRYARRREAARARLAALLERHRAAAGNAEALVERIGFAAVLAVASIEVMVASITPGALIATMLVLRQLQGLVDGMGRAWLRAVETAPHAERDAPGTAQRMQSISRLDVAPGEFVVVVGVTGAGKSTLLRTLVERHRQAGQTSRAIAWVEQQPLLCDRSIADALRLAAPRADASRIARALQVSQLAPLLRRLPAGADHPCGPHGEGLPAGMRHLVALAAALAREPRILVLDALPEALDAQLRQALLAALQAWRSDTRSLVVATASPSWVAAADRIVLLERGRVRADIRPGRRRDTA